MAPVKTKVQALKGADGPYEDEGAEDNDESDDYAEGVVIIAHYARANDVNETDYEFLGSRL